jgi:hypothetical protein
MDDFNVRTENPGFIDYLISIWVIGLICLELRNLLIYESIRDYFHSWNAIVNIVQTVLYIASFALKFYTIYMVNLNLDKVTSVEFWNRTLENITNTNYQLEVPYNCFETKITKENLFI